MKKVLHYHLSENIVSALKQGQRKTDNLHSYSMKSVKDGMDISLCVFDEESSVMKFAGANNPLYSVQHGVMKEIKGDRQPIGIFEGLLKPFTVHTIPLEGLEAVYIFTDGYADQFGGAQGKKFKYSRLKELFFNAHKLELQAQQKLLAEKIDQWKSNLDQVDDVLIAGFKF